MPKKKRRLFSVKEELIQKAREAALAAVQVFNNPLITFKSEMFIVNMHIAWTYLLHAYYRDRNTEYRYIRETSPSGRRRFDRTKSGAHKYWSLEDCLNCDKSPVEKDASNNLRFLIGLRHEIEHQMTSRIDDALSARFQACCLNFNEVIKKLFGEKYGIDRHLAFSLQFSSLSQDQAEVLESYKDILPGNVAKYVEGFDGNLTKEEFESTKFAYRVIFTPKTVNHVGQADKVIEFIDPASDAAKGINITYATIKEKEKTKYLATNIVRKVQAAGFPRFKIYAHTQLWRKNNAKNPTKGFGVDVEGYWYWYDTWLNFAIEHCKNNRKYT